jgi:hypothetical protein
MTFKIIGQFQTTNGTFIFLEVVRHISGFEYFMSEKRTQNFSGEIYFLDFGGAHNRSVRFGIVNIYQCRLNVKYNRLNTCF